MALAKLGGDNVDELDVSLGNIPLRWRITFPSSSGDITFPENAYFLEADVNGDYTKAMVEDTVALGEDYIVFDSDSFNKELNIYYSELGNDGNYIKISDIKGTPENPVTLDFRKVAIFCHHDPINYLWKQILFKVERCENVIVKFGTVEGDRYDRAFTDPLEINFDFTKWFQADRGSKNITLDGGSSAGFMADTLVSIVYGTQHIDTGTPDAQKLYYLQGDGRYESIFFDVDPTLYDGTFGVVGGVGFNRLLKFDLEDITFKFYDVNEVFISEITGAQYFVTYTFPVTARKIKVNVNPMDGRIESPTSFSNNLDYSPSYGTVVKNMRIGDHHRGGLANLGTDALVENCEFYNSSRYYSVPLFSDSTQYHLNCEDAVSRNAIINNNSFADKFHKILLTDNISIDITNNIFTGSGNNIFIYRLLSGNITGNTFNGTINLGVGTNKALILAHDNTGLVDLTLTNAGHWYNNNFTGGEVLGKGKMDNNTFTNTRYTGVTWNKDIHNNTFTGNDGSVPYMYGGAYVYQNTFNDTYFVFQNNGNPIYFDGVTIDNTANTGLVGFDRTYGDNTIICVNSIFKNLRIENDNDLGDWYFENCNFNDVSSYIVNLNTVNAVKFYFKNCNFVGSGGFIRNWQSNTSYEVILEDCTIDANITMPANHTIVVTGTIERLPLVEPRTQLKPNITYNTDHTNINLVFGNQQFHSFALIIRNKNTLEVFLDKEVTNTYQHYTATPNDFEYSIDGGVYWDSIIVP